MCEWSIRIEKQQWNSKSIFQIVCLNSWLSNTHTFFTSFIFVNSPKRETRHCLMMVGIYYYDLINLFNTFFLQFFALIFVEKSRKWISFFDSSFASFFWLRFFGAIEMSSSFSYHSFSILCFFIYCCFHSCSFRSTAKCYNTQRKTSKSLIDFYRVLLHAISISVTKWQKIGRGDMKWTLWPFFFCGSMFSEKETTTE